MANRDGVRGWKTLAVGNIRTPRERPEGPVGGRASMASGLFLKHSFSRSANEPSATPFRLLNPSNYPAYWKTLAVGNSGTRRDQA